MGITDSFPRSWRCERCTYQNDAFTGKCRICGAHKEAKLWICCGCGASNPVGIVLCNNCGSEQNTFGGKEKKGWSCSRCNYVNFSDSSLCSGCGCIRTLSNAPGSSKFKEDVWLQVDSTCLGSKELQEDLLKCHKCQTLLYDNTSSHCTVCGTPCLSEGFKPRPFPQSSLPKIKLDDTPGSSDIWSCCQCTLFNDPNQTTCKACGNKNTKQKTVEKLVQLDTWECSLCTLSNPSSAKFCHACNSSRDDSTWTKNADNLSVPNSPTHKTCETVGVEAKRIHDENQAKRQWKNIVEICSQHNMSFVDDSFPPGPTSLYMKPRPSAHPRVARWLRPHQIASDITSKLSWEVFRDPSPSDIIQGVLGDCWYVL